MISEALYNSRASPMCFRCPAEKLDSCFPSVIWVKGSTHVKGIKLSVGNTQSWDDINDLICGLLINKVPEETSYPLKRSIRNAIAQVAVSRNISSSPCSQHLFFFFFWWVRGKALVSFSNIQEGNQVYKLGKNSLRDKTNQIDSKLSILALWESTCMYNPKHSLFPA